MQFTSSLLLLKKLLITLRLVWNAMVDSNFEDTNRPRSTLPTDTNRPRSTLPTENGIDILRSSYSVIKRRLTENIDMVEDHLFIDVLAYTDFIRAMNSVENEKIDSVLTTVIRKGNSACEKFIKILKENNILQHFDDIDTQPKNLPCDAAQFSGVHYQIFRLPSLRNFLLDELEINSIIDDLYQWHLIDLDSHTAIRTLPERNLKVRELLSKMDSITENDWFRKFCCILTNYDENTRIIEMIRQSPSMSQNCGLLPTASTTSDDIFLKIGSTLKIITENLTEEMFRQLHIDDMNDQLPRNQQVSDVRDGCIEFVLLNSTITLTQEDSLQFIRKLIELSKSKSTLIPGQTFKVAVRQYDGNIPLLDDNGKMLRTFQNKLALKLSKIDVLESVADVNEVLQLLENNTHVKSETCQSLLRSEDDEIKKQYLVYCLSTCTEAELTIVLQKLQHLDKCRNIYECIQKWKCLNCYRKSILNEQQRVINEIDTIIMRQTLEGLNKLPKCLYEYCVEKADSIPRSERAKRFLHFVLIKGNLLMAFAEVLATKSKLSIQHSKCEHCVSGTSLDQEQAQEISEEVFNFEINDTGELVAMETKQEPAGSTNNLADSNTKVYGETEKRTHKRKQSIHEFSELPIAYIEQLEILLQTAEKKRKVTVLSGEEVLESKQLQEHRADKFVLIVLKET